MTKKQIVKAILQTYNGKKASFKEYDVSFLHHEQHYYVKIMPVTAKTIVTVNSSIMWELKKGRFDGPRFKTTSKELVDLKSFMKHEHKFIIFLEKPYKILKAINESDLEDISHLNSVHGVSYFFDVNEIENGIK